MLFFCSPYSPYSPGRARVHSMIRSDRRVLRPFNVTFVKGRFALEKIDICERSNDLEAG